MSPPVDTRERIIETARDLIHDRSYTGVGVAEICKQAGVQKGSFYHYFPSKQDLAVAVLDLLHSEYDGGVMRQAFQASQPPLERMRRAVALMADFQENAKATLGHMPGCPYGNIAAEMSTSDAVIRAKVERIFDHMESYFRGALEEARTQGIVGDIDTEASARAMLAFLEGVMLMAKTHNDPDLFRRLGPAVTDIRILHAEA